MSATASPTIATSFGDGLERSHGFSEFFDIAMDHATVADRRRPIKMTGDLTRSGNFAK